MAATDRLIEALRADIKAELRAEIMAELKPEIERSLFSNSFDLKEASRYLNISDSTLRRMVEAREIPHYKLRGQFFFRQADLDHHIDKLVKAAMRGGDGSAN